MASLVFVDRVLLGAVRMLDQAAKHPRWRLPAGREDATDVCGSHPRWEDLSLAPSWESLGV